jgi:glyoxylase-like metal-dependent hydrolase (beta-lactamase superfamily II)
MATVKVIKPGYLKFFPGTEDIAGASSTVTLIISDKKVIVDTGIRIDRQTIIEGIRKEGLEPEDIDLVVNTHPHGDHRGNNDLFENATFVENRECKLCEDVEMVHTPGHTSVCHSMLVHTDDRGMVAIVGDLISLESDLVTGRVLQTVDFDLQKRNRERILRMADYIIPGHGDGFKVTE